MRPQLDTETPDPSSSISLKRVCTPLVDYSHWHYHPEYEIFYIEKSSGVRLIGNHTGNFREGDLAFISANLPHLWKHDKNYYGGLKNQSIDIYVLHFREHALGNNFFNIPELKSIKKLFAFGERGYFLRGKHVKKVAGQIKALYRSSGPEKIILLLKILHTLAKASDYTLLSNNKWQYFSSNNSKKINRIINFVAANYAKPIKLEEVAELAHLSKPSFCRYFKSFTQKTYSQFLNEIRIAKACELLLDTDMPITSICYETGYNNISHFNRQFRTITGITARDFRNNKIHG